MYSSIFFNFTLTFELRAIFPHLKNDKPTEMENL